MSPLPTPSVRLSSRGTWVFRFLVPALHLFIVPILALTQGSFSPVAYPFLLAYWLAGFFWFRSTAFPLCHVWADSECLTVRRGRLHASIPYTSIRDAQQRHYFGFSEILLEEPSVFGNVIVFIPYTAQLIPYYTEHPADVLLQRRRRAALRAQSHRVA